MEKLMTLKEVAEYLGVCEKTVYFLMRKKGLPALKLGHRILRFKKDDVDVWLQTKKRKTRED